MRGPILKITSEMVMSLLVSLQRHYATQSQVGIGVEAAQAVIGHDAVLVHDGHDVGGDGYGHEVEQRLQLVVVGQAVAFGERLHELETHAAA